MRNFSNSTDALVTEARKASKFGAVTAAQITRTTEVQLQRAAAIKQRIEALEASKQAHIRQVDEAIQALREDLAGLEQRVAADSDLATPLAGVIGRERDGTVVSGGTPTRRSARRTKATGRRQSKDDDDE